MAMETSSLELVTSLKLVSELMDDMLRLITEDRPYDHSLAHRFEHAASEVAGRLDAALAAALDLQKAAGRQHHAQTLEALSRCHAEFNLMDEKFRSELDSFEWRQDLYTLGSEHPDEWMGWTASILATLDQCNPPAVHDALLKCWQNLLVFSGALSTHYVKDIDRQPAAPVHEEVAWNE